MSTTKRSPVAARPAVGKAAWRLSFAFTPRRPSLARPVQTRLIRTSASAGLDVALPEPTAFDADVAPLMSAVRRHVNLKPGQADALREDLRQVVHRVVVRQRQASVQAADDPVLTTQQAADLLGVSRPFVAARIDAGDIPLHQQVGNQRRVLKSEVLRWQERSKARRQAALIELARSIEDEYGDED